MNNPTPQQIRKARKEAGYGYTQERAAKLVHVSMRTWRRYEAGDTKMSAGTWELFNKKVGEKCKHHYI